jgi:hypothetical protein
VDDGTLVHEEEEIKRLLAQHYRCLAKKKQVEVEKMRDDQNDHKLFTTEDILEAMNQCNFNKGIGPDAFDAMIFKKDKDNKIQVSNEIKNVMNKNHYSQLNVPSSSEYINGNFYNLTTNAETFDGKDMLKMKGFTTHDLTNIRTYADEVIEAIEDEDLLQDIAENCCFIMFIHNLVGSLDSPDGGLGLENKVIGFLSPSSSKSTSVSVSKSPSVSKSMTRKIRSV